MEKIITKRNKKYYGYFILYSCIVALFAEGINSNAISFINGTKNTFHLILDLLMDGIFGYVYVSLLLRLIKRIPQYIIGNEGISMNNKTFLFKDLLQINFTNKQDIDLLFSTKRNCYTLTFQNSSVINIYYEYYTEPILIKQLLERQATIINSTKTIA